MRAKIVSTLPQWVGFAVLAGLLVLLALSSSQARPGGENQLLFAQRAVERAVVQCYALEGAYPPDIDYVRAHYGLHIDEERYFVHYRVEGANLRPEILVIQRQR